MDVSKRLPDFLPQLLTVIPSFLMCLEDLWIQYFSQTHVQLLHVCTWIHTPRPICLYTHWWERRLFTWGLWGQKAGLCPDYSLGPWTYFIT